MRKYFKLLPFLPLIFILSLFFLSRAQMVNAESCSCDYGEDGGWGSCLPNGVCEEENPFCISGTCYKEQRSERASCGEDEDCRPGMFCGDNGVNSNLCTKPCSQYSTKESCEAYYLGSLCFWYTGGSAPEIPHCVENNGNMCNANVCNGGHCYNDQLCRDGQYCWTPNGPSMSSACGASSPSGGSDPQPPATVDTCTSPQVYDSSGNGIYACRTSCNDGPGGFEEDVTSRGSTYYGCAASGSTYRCCKRKSVTVALPSTITCDSSTLATYASSIPDSLKSLAGSASISCVSGASACASGVGYPAGQTIPGTSSVISCPSGGSYCCAAAAAGPVPSTTDTCTTAGLGGNTWSCLAPANCPSGVYYSSSTNPALYACPSDKPQFCCKVTTGSGTGGGTTTALPGAPKVLGYERVCTSYDQIGYKFNFEPGTGATYHKLMYNGVPLGDETPPDSPGPGQTTVSNYTSGTVIPASGGNGFSTHIRVNYDLVACNAAGCTPDPNRWWYIADTGPACTSSGGTSSGACSTRGGIKSGPVGVCDRKILNDTDRIKTIAEGNPYYSKTYEDQYECNDGTKDWVNPDSTRCNAIPWYDPPSSPSGPAASSEYCDPSSPKEGCLCTSGACTATYQPIFSNWGCFITGFDSKARCCPNDTRYACSYGKCASNASSCTASPSTGSAGTKTCYKDVDGDGYGSATGGTQVNQISCTSGWSEKSGDCNDNKTEANPGQTGDFYVKMDNAPAGTDPWDYNCNGKVDKKYATHSFGSLPTGTCLSTIPSGTVGFSNSQECGTTGTFRLCYKFPTTACGTTTENIGVADTIGQSCHGGGAGNGWALVDAASVPQNCK